ncbi:hypothetical protein QV08_09995 [Gallibacterium salpingitidis]|uniref:3-hydroxy-fatty acyl-ACP dehydratase n=1 Tax=Gallibacterium salpingitidis TaxID=505341 RepID=A0A1A7P5F4_9PAST|nr:hypothetical protein [Gallibacterium salpingitidis]OBW96449.1 hypothetical protein QS62_00465 [Gallibacterium salpingitidis]OBX06458.1 hypothetical protein QV08_09995 [Gallibacterium salpingitidis]OBX08915.1 hypothetical protein QV09_09310 [Gallibacterium salpingitidis]WKS99396.1 hypothetical protein NYR30_11870 [Gallibacterium salpingitidis]
MLGKASDFLLHKQPMMLVDSLLECNETYVAVEVVIDQKHQLFLDETGRLPAWISIELMAQTVGVWAGYQAKLRDGSEPKIGFLLGGRQCQQYVSHYQVGDKLRIEAQIIMQDEKMASFAAKIINTQQNVVAEGRLTTYQPNDVEISGLQNLFTQNN